MQKVNWNLQLQLLRNSNFGIKNILVLRDKGTENWGVNFFVFLNKGPLFLFYQIYV